jgi:putative membrane protein
MSSDSLLPTPKLSREATNGDKSPNWGEVVLSPADQAKTAETVKILIAMLYTIKNHLRAEWGVALSPGTSLTADGQEANTDEYKDLLPPGLKGYEHRGLGLTLELATFVEKYIQMGVKKYDDFSPWVKN